MARLFFSSSFFFFFLFSDLAGKGSFSDGQRREIHSVSALRKIPMHGGGSDLAAGLNHVMRGPRGSESLSEKIDFTPKRGAERGGGGAAANHQLSAATRQTDKPVRASNRETRKKKMLVPEDPWMPHGPNRFAGAFPPFPRSLWIHPRLPHDNFDRVCKSIWRRAKEAEEELGRGQSSPERQQREDGRPSHRAEEQQKETDDLGPSTRHMEDKQQYHTGFTLPCPYLSGHRHTHRAEPARALNPAMEEEMRQNEEQAKGKRNLEKDEEDKQSCAAKSSFKKSLVPQSGSRRERQRDEPEPQPLVTNPASAATEDPYQEDEKDHPLPFKLLRERSLPGVRACATDSSDDDSPSDNNDCEEEANEIPRSSDELSSDSEPHSPSSSTETDFPPLSTIKASIQPCPTEPPASGKMHGQWEIPLSFHPHNIPTATLASGVTTPVQGKAEAPQANPRTNAAPAAPAQQEAYDLLADFPALQPPKKPLVLGVLHDGNPKTKGAEGKSGLTHSQNHRQERGAPHQRRMENVPQEVSSICAGDQKSVLDLQKFGSTIHRNSPTISCEELKANNQPPPRVAGTDGVGLNARSWASAAKAGMRQTAAPQEKAKPCTSQQIVTINRGKAGHSATQTPTYKATPSHQAAMTATCHGPRPRNPSQFVRTDYTPSHQQFGARAHRANCPPGFRCPRFPFQQARGGETDEGLEEEGGEEEVTLVFEYQQGCCCLTTCDANVAGVQIDNIGPGAADLEAERRGMSKSKEEVKVEESGRGGRVTGRKEGGKRMYIIKIKGSTLRSGRVICCQRFFNSDRRAGESFLFGDSERKKKRRRRGGGGGRGEEGMVEDEKGGGERLMSFSSDTFR
ncbi:hypothetical protein L3Q82_003029 [Scortum barcoo]|uniref:Uncharacterized protein n=1 Tax=Scortum barcoo TaxID=214431 RepID=A0ACB8VQZ4_9TELE|nr:hypothetical protein L3Q82_003029 [Scortum barcoo]